MLKLTAIAVVVRDEEKAAKFYTEKLGLKLVTKWPQWHTVSAGRSGVRIHLCPDAPPEKGNTGISFHTADCKKTEAEFRKKGVKITERTTKEEWGTYFMFSDPDGNEFWVFQG